MQIENYIELTSLKPGTLISDVESLCNEAVENKIGSVAVPPLFVKKAKELTEETGIGICAVTGFPFGYSNIEAKIAEIVLAIIDNADEIEMVANTSAMKNNDWQYIAYEINTVMPLVRGKGKKMTVVVETGLLTDKEIITACDIYGVAGIDHLKVGTGFMDNALLPDNMQLVRDHLAAAVRLKAPAVGIGFAMAQKLIKAGADRLCCTGSVKLIQESIQQN